MSRYWERYRLVLVTNTHDRRNIVTSRFDPPPAFGLTAISPRSPGARPRERFLELAAAARERLDPGLAPQPGARTPHRPRAGLDRAGGVTRRAGAEAEDGAAVDTPGTRRHPGRFWGGCCCTVHRFSQKYLANSSISALYLQYRPHFKAWYPCF